MDGAAQDSLHDRAGWFKYCLMERFRLLNSLGLCLLLTLGGAGLGCRAPRSDVSQLRPAADLPEQFVAADRTAPAAPGRSRSPMVDPRDGTQIILVRSTPEWGDYQVPPGRYGVKTGELLRLEPATGRVFGIVKR